MAGETHRQSALAARTYELSRLCQIVFMSCFIFLRFYDVILPLPSLNNEMILTAVLINLECEKIHQATLLSHGMAICDMTEK